MRCLAETPASIKLESSIKFQSKHNNQKCLKTLPNVPGGMKSYLEKKKPSFLSYGVWEEYEKFPLCVYTLTNFFPKQLCKNTINGEF